MSSFFAPSSAFSSHLGPDGAPLSELPWSSSLAVVALSFSGLFTAVALMLACLCCKKGGIGFKEFENVEGEEYPAEFSAQGSPAAAAQNGPDVYVLPLTEVSLPMAKQPGRSVQLLKATDLGRHSLLYLEEIGHGWFGKVFLGEVSSGIGSTQVVVKELQASASVREQMQFLQEAQPYRVLQHSNLLQCLAQCTEVTPYLLVMEFCPLGDLKGYLRSCRVAESMAPDPLTLQRMACEVACGVFHLHRNNYVHRGRALEDAVMDVAPDAAPAVLPNNILVLSGVTGDSSISDFVEEGSCQPPDPPAGPRGPSDLALRNCLLTADLTVKLGDYGLSHSKYREDYFVTTDQLWVPLRWIAPELVDEVHCNLLVVEQTKASNVWSLGVTIWELFELGAQPYPQHSDRQVLAYAVREQQLKLPKPQLQLSLADRWYEVMQFCWLQPEQRPTAEEVHLLLSYLCATGNTEAEEEFEQRWRSLRPGGGGTGPGLALGGAGELVAASSFPLLEQFAGDGFHVDGDDVLTVTETSRGLNFEYKWEAGRGAEAFPPPGATPSPGHTPCPQELCAPDGATPGVVPVLSAHSPSVGSEYFIRLEEPAPVAGHDPDCAGCVASPTATAPSSQGSDRNEDSDGSAATSLAKEPLLDQAPPTASPWGHDDRYPRRGVTQDQPCLPALSSPKAPMSTEPGKEGTDWGVATFRPPSFEDPLSASPSETPGARGPLGELEEPGETEARRAAQHRHWNSNVSANNNSGSWAPESWGPGHAGGHTDGCPGRKQILRAAPELGHPLAPEDPGEPLLGPGGASIGQEPGCRLGLPHPGPTGGPAPATRLVTSPWTEAAICGGNSPHTEPRLAEEAEGAAGAKLPLPSLPPPSQEGAPLPTEARAPTPLPALPTPAGSWATAAEPAPALEPEAPGSEDEAATEATAGVLTDVSSDERRDVTPAFRSLQEQAGTPDSLDIPSSASEGGCEVGSSGGQPRALDSGYDTENYESPEFVLREAHEPCGPEAFGERASEGASPAAEAQLSTSLGGLSEKNPHRDSAYFSDLDAEPETPVGPGKSGGGVPAPGPGLENPQSAGVQPGQPGSEPAVPGEVPGEVQPRPPREASSPQPRACAPGPGPLWSPGPAAVPPGPGPGRPKVFLLTPVPSGSDGRHSELREALQDRAPGAPRAPLCLALPGPPAAPEGRQDDDDDSEDSDESDEGLRCYSVQEPSDASDEEAPPVPVVVAESQSARNLRGLLKMPGLLSRALRADLGRRKKAVSFFDDVTVYLFDQESPTRELGEPFPGAKDSPPAPLAGGPSSPGGPGRPQRPEGSPDGMAAAGAGFEWAEGFPPTPTTVAPERAPAAPAAPAAPSKAAAPGLLSRFTVSPAPASRFSITHVSDSDAGPVGGPASGAGGSCKEA